MPLTPFFPFLLFCFSLMPYSFFLSLNILTLLHSLILASCSWQYVERRKSGCLHKLISASLLGVFATSLLPTQTRKQTHNYKYPRLSVFRFSFLTLWNSLFCHLLHCFPCGSERKKPKELGINSKTSQIQLSLELCFYRKCRNPVFSNKNHGLQGQLTLKSICTYLEFVLFCCGLFGIKNLSLKIPIITPASPSLKKKRVLTLSLCI